MNEKVEKLVLELSECTALEMEQILITLQERFNIQKPKCVNCKFRKKYERDLTRYNVST